MAGQPCLLLVQSVAQQSQLDAFAAIYDFMYMCETRCYMSTVVTKTHRAHTISHNGMFCTITHGGSLGVKLGSNGAPKGAIRGFVPTTQGSE